jgi:pimeloyl-ACP methyl ester carboxylesterase
MRIPNYGRRSILAVGLALFAAACARSLPPQAAARPSSEQAVRFTNGDVTLAGTLVLPARPQPHPAVVLFHGSGPQSRGLFMARWFAGIGVAALAYDKRGVGESTGNFRKVPFMELCGDGLAGIQYLKSRQEIDPKRIGVWGLSQGGWLGPLAASRSPDIAWVIAVSGPAVSPGEQMMFYYAEELRARALPEKQVREATALRRTVWTYLFTIQGYENARDQLARARSAPWYSAVSAQQDNLFEPLQTPADLEKGALLRFRREMTYDPLPALRALKVPVLFLYGDEDRLVNVPETVPILRRIQAQGSHDFTIQVFSHVDHTMNFTADGRLDPDYLATMQQWLSSHLQR